MAAADALARVVLLAARPAWRRAYTWPFAAVHAATTAVAAGPATGAGMPELGVLLVAIGIAAHVVAYVACGWSVRWLAWAAFRRVRSLHEADSVLVIPAPGNGAAGIAPLLRRRCPCPAGNRNGRDDRDAHDDHGDGDADDAYSFEFHRRKYRCSADGTRSDAVRVEPLPYPDAQPLSHYLRHRGLSDDAAVAAARRRYGKNVFDFPLPTFAQLFREQATAPFFLFQVLCVGLWLLDEYWYFSLFTLLMLVVFEATVVKQRLRNLAELRQMRMQPYSVCVYRGNKWTRIMTDDLLPGDLVSLTRSADEQRQVPCDVLLLAGTCIVNEAMLTGESVPQMKESLSASDYGAESERALEVDGFAKAHVLFGGTRILQHAAHDGRAPSTRAEYEGDLPQASAAGPFASALRPPDRGCVGYVLRSGFGTAQGSLVCTILFNSERVTANSMEGLVLILFLLMFALLASAYVWTHGVVDAKRSRYKLLLECVLIVTSCVPPELPMELSLAVNTSLIALARLYVFCTEPFRIPYAGKVDVCCFDKTGTLTSSDIVVDGIAGVPADGQSSTDVGADAQPRPASEAVVPVARAGDTVADAVAACHSVVYVEGEGLVGDPQEKAALQALSCMVHRDGAVLVQSGRRRRLRVQRRFHFSSSLKRMGVIATVEYLGDNSGGGSSSSSRWIAVVKGAPEALAPMMERPPPNYDQLYRSYAYAGARVLALASKVLRPMSSAALASAVRADVESGLSFVGFLLMRCPLKPDSDRVVRELRDASHYVAMITGDSPLTAIHVARSVSMITRTPLLLSDGSDEAGGRTAWANDGHASIDGRPHAEAGTEASAGLHWRAADATSDTALPLLPTDANLGRLVTTHDLCMTGHSMRLLRASQPSLLRRLLPHVRVFARVTPADKQFIVASLNEAGYTTLMCGDGTNDVGALKQAHVGIALLNGSPESLQRELELRLQRQRAQQQQQQRRHHHQQQRAALQAHSAIQARLADLDEETPPPVRLGDASIASPFTSKLASPGAVLHIVRQGRCTLVTTQQMFRILALNCLINAYSLSVLYLDGVKLGDSQATVQSMLLASCFLFISRSRPLEHLSRQRPLPTIFNLYMPLTVLLQSAVHMSSLVYVVREAKLVSDPPSLSSPSSLPSEASHAIDLDAAAVESTLNSAVFLLSMAMQVSTFAVNYQGYPFMQRLRDNRPLLVSLLLSVAVVLVAVSGWFPSVATQLQVLDFSTEV